MSEEFIEEDFKQSDMGYFAIIPSRMIQDRRINLFDVVLFGTLSSLSKRDGHCWASNRYLADIMACSLRQIPRSISRLKSSSYIRIDVGKDEKRLIFINFDSPTPLDTAVRGHDQTVMGGCSFCHGGMTKLSSPFIRDSKGYSKEDRSIVGQGPDLEAPVLFLNKLTGKNFDPKNKATNRLIRGRLAEGRTLQDFNTVIERKVKKWLHDPKMSDFLRPSTLFNQTNFENYLNEKESADGVPENFRHLVT